ncbi:MAG: hypothetical protein IIC69_03540 [Nanoarchaeota archaeon]|nr:hypothetical protein [Nanoarchaeota archaeon]
MLSFVGGAILLLATSLLVKDDFVFTKEHGAIKDKPRFYTKFLGVMFVLALSFTANNIFVYVISIFIIATLVTELQFLEMLIALIWDRPEYVKGKFEALIKQQEEERGDTTKMTEIRKLAREARGELETEKVQKKQYLLFYHFERIYRLIFGSQLKIMLEAEQNEGKISLLRTVMHYRTSGWAQRGYNVGDYTLFLVNLGLLTYTTAEKQDDAFYTLTPLGRSFISYLRTNKISLDKPF